jgi:hypothetical protein
MAPYGQGMKKYDDKILLRSGIGLVLDGIEPIADAKSCPWIIVRVEPLSKPNLNDRTLHSGQG